MSGTLLDILLWVSLSVLVLTKGADVYTTWRGIDPAGISESNPIARWLFAHMGVTGGLVLVWLVWLELVAVAYGNVRTGAGGYKATVVLLAFGVSW